MKEGKISHIIVILLSVTVLNQLATDIYLPSIQFIGYDLALPQRILQLFFPAFLCGAALGYLVCGIYAPYFCQKKLLMSLISLYIAASLAACIVENYLIFIMLRVFNGFALGSSVVILSVFKENVSSIKISKVLAYNAIVWSVVPLISPLIGSQFYLYYGSWKISFLFLSILGIIVLTYILFFLPGSEPSKKTSLPCCKAVFQDVISCLAQTKMLVPLLLLCLNYGIIISIVAVSPFLYQNKFSLGIGEYGFILTIISTGHLFGGIAATILTNQHSDEVVILLGLKATLLACAGFFLFALFFDANIALISIFLFLISTCIAISYPVCMGYTLSQASEEHSSLSAAYMFGMPMLAGGIISFAASRIYYCSELRLSAFYAFLAAIAYFAWVMFMSKKTGTSPKTTYAR